MKLKNSTVTKVNPNYKTLNDLEIKINSNASVKIFDQHDENLLFELPSTKSTSHSSNDIKSSQLPPSLQSITQVNPPLNGNSQSLTTQKSLYVPISSLVPSHNQLVFIILRLTSLIMGINI